MLRQIGVNNPNTFTTGDIAILLEQLPFEDLLKMVKDENLTVNKGPVVAVCIRGSDINNPAFKNSIINYCIYMMENYDAQIWFIPFQFSGSDDDRPGISILKDELKENKIIHYFSKEYSPRQILGLISMADIVIGERFHSAIFSIIAKKPVIGISYLPKVERLFKEIGYRQYCVSLKDINGNSIIGRFEDIWENREKIMSDFNNIYECLKKKALLNFEILSKIKI
jgi:polysaccharide pyruvyl transferase WcaK-like protein